VRQHHQHAVADRRHVGLELVGVFGVFELEGDADLRKTLGVAVGQVDDERIQRQEDGRSLLVIVFLLGHRGCLFGDRGAVVGLAGFGHRCGRAFLDHEIRSAAPARRQHQQCRRDDDDELLLAPESAGRCRSFAVNDGFGSSSGHVLSFGSTRTQWRAPAGGVS
jgi:hypothetical protein